jgi:predicted nuclease of predicted toxin-antitoxin system
MRLLADESCDYGVVTALRVAGHDVAAVVEDSRGVEDREVFARSRRERRVLLTEDKDFGQMAVASDLGAEEGVLLIRCPEQSREELPVSIVSLVETLGKRLLGAIVVWTPTRTRFRSLRGMAGTTAE